MWVYLVTVLLLVRVKEPMQLGASRLPIHSVNTGRTHGEHNTTTLVVSRGTYPLHPMPDNKRTQHTAAE